MSHLPEAKQFKLANGQPIQTVLPTWSNGTCLLEANTGLGKTSYVMQSLTETHDVIMLCPFKSQIIQLGRVIN